MLNSGHNLHPRPRQTHNSAMCMTSMLNIENKNPFYSENNAFIRYFKL